MYNGRWWRAVIALLHIERTILVFQRCTLLHPFPHINLSHVLSLLLCSHVPGLWLICLCPHVIKSCKSSSLPTYNSPYYFRKVVWSPSSDYSIPCSYVPRVPSSFKYVFSPGMEYGNVFYLMCGWCFSISHNHFINLPIGQLVRMSLVYQCFLSWSFVAQLFSETQGGIGPETTCIGDKKMKIRVSWSLFIFHSPLLLTASAFFSVWFYINSQRMWSWSFGFRSWCVQVLEA